MIYIGYFALKKDKLYITIPLLLVSIYEFGYAFEIMYSTIEWVKFWIKVEYIGISFLPVGWFVFCINFTGNKDKVKKGLLASLLILSTTILIMNYTNDFHHLFYRKVYINSNEVFPIAEFIKGPWYWINIAYTYFMMLVGLIIFIVTYFKSVAFVRKQLLFLIIAWVIPWISDIVYMFKILTFHIDLCPIAFSVSAMISSYGILRVKLVKLTPIATQKVFSNMLDGVVILDQEDNIVNFNDSAKNVIPDLAHISAGDKKIEEVLPKYRELLKHCNDNIITIKKEVQICYYKLKINNIYESNGGIIGKILIFNDVTELEVSRKKISDNLNFLQKLIDAIPNPIYYKDKQGVYNHCNLAFADFIGRNNEEIIGNTTAEVFQNNLAQTYNESDKNLIDKRGTQVYESKLMHKDRTHHDVIFSKSVVENEEGESQGLVGVIIDITEQKKNEEKINKLLKLKEIMIKIGYSINEIANINDMFQLILDEVISCIDDRSSGSILLLDKENNLKIAVAKGYDIEEIKKFSISLEDHFYWFNKGERIHETVIFNGVNKHRGVTVLDTKSGKKIKSIISSPIIIDGDIYGFLNIDSTYDNVFNEWDLEVMEYMRNQASLAITKHKLYEQTLYLSRYDKLTKLYNRSYFEQLLYEDIYKNCEKQEFILVSFDLNELKFVNDNYGHLSGDKYIQAFSTALADLACDKDIIGRFGGDEFVGVFFNVSDNSLIDKLEALKESFRNNPIIFEESNIICSFSYGMVKYPQEGYKTNELLKIADERMYKYKRLGKIKS